MYDEEPQVSFNEAELDYAETHGFFRLESMTS